MTGIEDPWYSRPIDVHRISDHPEVRDLIERLWLAHYQDFAQPGRSGPKPKTSFKQQFGVVILDLFVAWKTDPERSIGVPMSSNGWNTNSRYNALKLSKNIIPLVQRAHDVGLIDLNGGSYSGEYGRGNRNTRIRAAEPLKQLFSEITADASDVRHDPNKECIFLKQGEALVEYEDTAETVAMRDRLRAYNALLLRTFIDIPSLDQPFIERPILTGRDAGKVDRVTICDDHKSVWRIFNRGRWDLNGRFYGPWWQQVGKEWRSKIFINDSPTVEIDFKGLHINLLSLEEDVVIEGDPYELTGQVFPIIPHHQQRELVKKLVLTAINATTTNSAFSSFRADWPTGHPAKTLTNVQLTSLLDLFFEKHPQLEGKLCSDQGIRLMYIDSRITDQVLRVARNYDIPVLGIHDSFIVAQEHRDYLIPIMEVAGRELVGTTLKVDITEKDHKQNRSKGYLERLSRHQARHS